MLLYDRAQLDGDNSELDTLKRLASSHYGHAALLGCSEETLPVLPYSIPHCTSKQSSQNRIPTTAASVASGYMMKVERTATDCQTSAKMAKVLLIPESSQAKLNFLAGQIRSTCTSTQADMHREQPGSEQKVRVPLKSKNITGHSAKSVPLSDVMNVKLTPPLQDRQSLVSLVPLSSVASVPSTQVKSEWNGQVRVKLEPGISCPPARKRKLPVEIGMFYTVLF